MEQPTAIAIEVSESVIVLESAKLRRFENGFLLGETTSRDKISRGSKRRAHELLVIDHSDPHITMKYHHVQEYDAAGQPAGAPHEHTEIFPARRRRR